MELLEQVGLPRAAVTRYPHEFSGGQRPRIAIARALSVKPKLIICDEPTSALDASTQARVLALLQSLQRDTGVAYLFISHDLAVVRKISDRIAVLYRGEIVELGTAAQVTDSPRNDYSRQLQLSTPVPDPVAQRLRREQRRALLAAQGKSVIDG
jgi:peptide/nickel transport system ATP-binding protein